MTTTLITGANKGIGFETARGLIAAGHTVYVGAHDPEHGQAAADQLGARFVQIDVTDGTRLLPPPPRPSKPTGDWTCWSANAGVEPSPTRRWVHRPRHGDRRQCARRVRHQRVRAGRGAARLLAPAAKVRQPRGRQHNKQYFVDPGRGRPDGPAHFYPDVSYPAWKAAVNMLTVQYANAFGDMRINAVDRGFTATDSTTTPAPRPSRRARRSSFVWHKSVPTGPPAPARTPLGRCPGRC